MARVLLVEDEPAIRLAVRDALGFAGHAVDAVEDGEAALKRGLERTHDLIVLDLRLPRLDGLEVCRRLRAASVRTPLLMLTALGTEADKLEGLGAGADDYVPKPFSVKELLARVAALLRRADWDRGGVPRARLRCGGADVDLDRLEA
ncbi:MAG: response regulator transcription factor, partial [Candidatus Rokubacteria bacterium]|nr:response regulator transcription factor [Candidatus Rokubacteria bacterium]